MFDFSYETQAFFIDAASNSVGFAANWLLQSTILISIGLFMGWILKSRGSAAQSVVYRTTLLAILACPLATLALSASGFTGWSIDMPIARGGSDFVDSPSSANSDLDLALPTVVMSPAVAVPRNQLPDGGLESTPSDNEFGTGESIVTLPPIQSTESNIESAAAAEVPQISQPPLATAPEQVSIAVFGFAAITCSVIWLFVALFFLVRLSTAWLSLRRLTNASTPVEPSIVETCEDLARKIDVSTPRVLRSPFLPSPCLAGIRRPVILMPAQDCELSIEDLLVHELAHLRRRDCHWNLLRQIATAVFFFQPLAWVLSRRIEVTAEEVCDDFVVQFGGNRADYANRLVNIAELSSARIAPAGVGIVSFRSMLSSRVSRILDTSRVISTRASRLILLSVLGCGIVSTAVTGLVGLGSASISAIPETAMDGKDSIDEPNSTFVSTPPIQEGSKAASPAVVASVQNPTMVKKDDSKKKDDLIYGVVVDSNKKLIAGAQFYSFASRSWEHDPMRPKLIATTDKKGKFSFRKPKLDLPEDAPGNWNYHSWLVVKAPGHGFVTERPSSLLRQMEQIKSPQGWLAKTFMGMSGAMVVLPPAGNPIKGRIVDVDGQPVDGAKVRIQWFSGYGSGGFTRGNPNEKRSGNFTDDSPEQWKGSIDSLVQIIEPQQAIDAFPTATTDSDGRFVLKDIGPNRLFTLIVQGKNIETKKIYAYNQPGEKITVSSKYNGPVGDKYIVHPQEFMHVAGPSNPVTGKVIDHDTNRAIPNALVIATGVHGSNRSLGGLRGLLTTRTDDQGNFRIEGLPVGRGNRLVSFCKDSDAPYPLLGFNTDTSQGPVETEMRMKKGVWAEGRVCDSETKEPWTGQINYYYFRNPILEEETPGIRRASLQFAYWTNTDGGFRVPVWPSRGLLCYFHNPRSHEEAMERPIDKYPRGALVGKIDYDRKRGILETFPSAVIPSNYWLTKEISPDGSEDSFVADMPLVASRSMMVKVSWPTDTNVKRYRLYNNNGHKFWNQTDSAEVEIKGLKQGERRDVFAFHRGKNLIGEVTVDASMPTASVTEISDFKEAGFIVGQVVDEDGEPIVNGILDAQETRWAFHPGKIQNPSRIPTDENGNFRLTGIVPGKKYGASVSAPRKYMNRMMHMGIGDAFSGVVVKPGETKDLGTIFVGAKKKKETQTSTKSETKKNKESSTASS